MLLNSEPRVLSRHRCAVSQADVLENSDLWNSRPSGLPNPEQQMGVTASTILLPESLTIDLERYATAKDVPYKRDEDAEEGTGSNTIVYRATIRGTDEAVAIKKINCVQKGTIGSSDVSEARIHSEISMLKQCNHLNLVKFIAAYTVETLQNNYFIVMQPWAPITLAHLVSSVTSPAKSSLCAWWNECTDFNKCQIPFRGLLDGLAFLHSQLIFHKDVKPENILFDSSITPIITDFDVSKLYKPKALTNYTNSTYQYLAPEQVDHKESSLKSDVFAMGCCFLLLFIAVTDGDQELSPLYNIVHDNSCQYASEVPGIFLALQKNMKSIKHDRLMILGFLVRDMLITDPDTRPTGSSVRKLLDEIREEETTRRSWINYLGATTTLSDCLGSTEIFNDFKISLLSTKLSDNNGERLYRWRVRILQSADSSSDIHTMLSLDTGSDFNLISSEFMQDLRASGYQLDERTLALPIVVYGLGGPSVVLKQEVTLTLQREGDATQTGENQVTFREDFHVLHGLEAFFSLLLGYGAISRLGLMSRWNRHFLSI
jgi:serine/threonine protein kinase